jgi:hypothetical protein
MDNTRNQNSAIYTGSFFHASAHSGGTLGRYLRPVRSTHNKKVRFTMAQSVPCKSEYKATPDITRLPLAHWGIQKKKPLKIQ